MHTVLVSVDNDKKRAVIFVVLIIIIIIINRNIDEKEKTSFCFLFALFLMLLYCILSGKRPSIYHKNVDRLECLSSHFRERLARTLINIQFKKETIFREAHIHMHQGTRICASDESYCSDVTTHIHKRIV